MTTEFHIYRRKIRSKNKTKSHWYFYFLDSHGKRIYRACKNQQAEGGREKNNEEMD